MSWRKAGELVRAWKALKKGDMRLYRDPVHGDILLAGLAAALLDTAEFQRLSRIMQLGFAHLVYRGATHTRLAHSVGTYWMTREILRHVEGNHQRLNLPLPEGPLTGRGESGLAALGEVVSTAALLHDITHIPFGHTLEDELQDIYLKHDALASPRLWFLLFDGRSGVAKVFERREAYVDGVDNDTLRWLVYLTLAYRDEGEGGRGFDALLAEAREEVAGSERHTPDVRAAFGAFLGEAGERLEELSAKGLFQPFMADAISGNVSADLLDYTARDLYFTGLRGDFDQRLLHYFFIGRDERTGAHRLALDVLSPRGYARIHVTTEIMNLMRLRYSMAERVYYHKTKVAASAMLARALVGHNMPADTNPYDDAESVLRPDLSDEAMIRGLMAGGTGRSAEGFDVLSAAEAAEIGRSLLERRLYVSAAVLTESTVRRLGDPEKYVEHFRGRPGGRERLQKLQRELSAMTGQGPHSVLIYCPPRKMQAKAITAPVRMARSGLVPLAEHPDFAAEAEVLNRKYQSLWKAFALVHPEAAQKPGVLKRVAEGFCGAIGIPRSAWGEVSAGAGDETE